MSSKSEFFSDVDSSFPDNVAEAIGADDMRARLKQLGGNLFDTFGNLDLLETGDKSGLVAAINELANTALSRMWVSATGSGSALDGGDDTQFIRDSIAGSGGRGVWFEPKIYRVSANIQLPNNASVSFAKGAKILVTANLPATASDGNDTTYVFLGGDSCLIENVEIDGQGFNTGGILLLNRSNTTVRGCSVRNCIGDRFGIGVVGGKNNRVVVNSIQDCVHGINAFRSVSLHILGNSTNRNFSGIYLVACVKSIIAHNIVENNDDVGIDCEHCINCSVYCNYSARSANGEYAIFSGGAENADQGTQQGVIFKGNIAVRKATYVTQLDGSGNEVTAGCAAGRGACDFASLMAGAFNCGFEQNTLYVEFGYGLSHYQSTDKSNRSVFFRNNTVISTTGKFWLVLNSDGLEIADNRLYGRAATEAGTNETRDGHGLRVINNLFCYDVPKTGDYALLISTSSTFATKAPLVMGNTFVNAGAYALKIDSYLNAGLLPVVRNNDLGDDYTANGGLTITTNGNAVLRAQLLRILFQQGSTNVLTALDGLQHAGVVRATGPLAYGSDNFTSLLADMYYSSSSGLAVVTHLTPPTGGSLATASGTTLSLSNTDGRTLYGFADLTLTSF